MNHSESSSRARLAFRLILAGFLVYSAIYIYRTSFEIDGRRFFCLFDDAMISMRYAQNLAEGHGLAWNPEGPHIEGYTNFLWMLYMSALHLLPVAQAQISVLVQISAAAALALNLLLVLRLARLSGCSTLAALSAVGLTAFYLPLNTWSLQGMEVGVLALLISAAVIRALRQLQHDRLDPLLYALLALAMLVRIDAALPCAGIVLFLFAAERNRKRFALGVGVCLLVVGGQTLFRMAYFGDPLPNTYYLKMTGYPVVLRLARGWTVFCEFAAEANPALLLLAVVLLLVDRSRAVLLLWWVCLLQVLYSIYVGGDAWEWWIGSNRYISVIMPLFFVLLTRSLDRVGQALSSIMFRSTAVDPTRRARPAQASTALMALLSLISFNQLLHPEGLRQWLLLSRPLYVAINEENVRRGRLIREITAPQAVIAVCYAGATPYFSRRSAIDLLGKNDPVVARMDMRPPPPTAERNAWFTPGHLKWDYAHSIGRLAPDVIEGLFTASDPAEAQPFLEGTYRAVLFLGRTMYLREGSPRIDWDSVDRLW